VPKGTLSSRSGYFGFGTGVICYGRLCGGTPSEGPGQALYDVTADVVIKDGTIYVPFDPSEAASNLRCELYVDDWRRGTLMSTLARVYYFFRPVLPASVRRHVQRFHFHGWDRRPFPRWPVDCSVDQMFEKLLLLALEASGADRIPIIWFWPEGASSCAIITHDVETQLGRDFCSKLMDIDESFGIKASFQIVPEQRYTVSSEFLGSIRRRGFEVVVHDLNHDGHLYRDREQFRKRASEINAYGRAYGADGFRAGALYRKQVWYDALEFAYDMSVPNVAHLDPQRGGCCTVMPYFLGNILELPVTTTQDYTLFNILDDYSPRVWQQQIELIMQRHGLMTFIAHPDYIASPRARRVYEELLGHLGQLRESKRVWTTTPGEVNRWWRQRAEMRLIEDEDGWRIEGSGKERARIAYASEREGRLVFTFAAETGIAVRGAGGF
jgi:hypothetical protein